MADDDSAHVAAAPRPDDRRAILVLYNIAKRRNYGEILRTAAALGVGEVVVVGMNKISTQGAHGADKFLTFTHTESLAQAMAYVRDERGARVCGIEIVDGATPVTETSFSERTGASPARAHTAARAHARLTRAARAGLAAFMLGNEGQGMSEQQLAQCDHFVYIPQYSGATASLNVNAACAVVLATYARWAGLHEAARAGHKYVVPERAPSSVPRSGVGVQQMRSLAPKRGREGRVEGGVADEQNDAGNNDDDDDDAHQQHAAAGGLFDDDE